MADEAGRTPPGGDASPGPGGGTEPAGQSAVARRLVIEGLVQGVYYRYATRQAATELGLAGWVRNCRDGSVEALVQGPPERVEQLIAWCREGPRGARVERVDVEDAALDARLTGFGIR